jgi:hypothetical protein
MSITITITIPGPSTLPRIPAPRQTPDDGPGATRAEQVWRTVRPYLPVLLAGAESLLPGLGVVVALAGVIGVRACGEGEDRAGDHDDERGTAA